MDDPRSLWQSQEVEEMRFPVEELRAKAAKFQRLIRWRNWREQAAAVVVIVICARAVWTTPDAVERIGYALMIAGAIYIIVHLWVWGSAQSLPGDLGRADCISFYQSELRRQRDLLRGIWKWYIGPLIPGLAVLTVYHIVIAPPGKRWFPVIYAMVVPAFLWFVGRLNLRAARQIDGRIQELGL